MRIELDIPIPPIGQNIIMVPIHYCGGHVVDAGGYGFEECKTGKWIYHIDDLFPAESTQECDQCHEHQYLTCDNNFCPNCGAKMEDKDA